MSPPSYSALEEKVFIVTGAAGGLGLAICRALDEAGARVVVADLDADRAKAAAGTLSARGHLGVAMDVADTQSASRCLADTMARFDRLDGLINNAGVDVTAPVQELDAGQWERVLRTNLTGPFLMSKLALEYLGAGSHIVNIASTASRRAWPNASAYHASKWGLLGLSHALHAELRPRGIKVSAVIAGGMRTPFLLDRFPDIDTETLQDPENVANAVRFVLMQPEGTVIPEVMVLPMRESSWP